ncbi:MAG: hypothetical protein J7K13_00245 [Thermoplasmata archaeon]|nr:hypothetical protein [Thermoplasmata archaeon]
MDLVSMFIFLVIFGLIGFVIGYFTGFNPANLFANISAVAIISPLIFTVLKTSSNPDYAIDAVGDIMKWLADNLPGIIIGDAAGAVVGAIVGESRR